MLGNRLRQHGRDFKYMGIIHFVEVTEANDNFGYQNRYYFMA